MAFFKRQSKTAAPTLEPSIGNSKSVFDAETEKRIFEIGSTLLDLARSKKQSWLSTAFWSDKLMDWAMEDEDFKIPYQGRLMNKMYNITGGFNRAYLKDSMGSVYVPSSTLKIENAPLRSIIKALIRKIKLILKTSIKNILI